MWILLALIAVASPSPPVDEVPTAVHGRAAHDYLVQLRYFKDSVPDLGVRHLSRREIRFNHRVVVIRRRA